MSTELVFLTPASFHCPVLASAVLVPNLIACVGEGAAHIIWFFW